MGSLQRRWRLSAAALPLAIAFAVAAAACVSLDGLAGGSEDGDAGPAGGGGAILGDARGGPDPSAPIQETTGTSSDTGTPPTDESAKDASLDDPTLDASAPVSDAGCTSEAGVLVVLGAPLTVSPPFGGDSGIAFADTCPPGAALVGLNLVADTAAPFALLQVQGICEVVSIGACSGALTFGPPTRLGDHGDASPGDAGSLQCPAGSVAIGASAFAQKYVHSVTLQCAPLVTSLSDAGAALTLGAEATIGPFGGTGGNALPPFECPPASLVNALGGTAGGDGFVDSIVLGCATPSPGK